MTVTVYAKHPPYTDGHLADIQDEMDHAGPPTIRVVERGEKVYFALEGSHRLFEAHQRGIIPKLVVVIEELDDELGSYWNKITDTLPKYVFERAYVMKLDNVATKAGIIHE